ncbi:unnamed protein product [Prorocentrum cordatum]|uniref:Uncharacterized protein n=1 Tax=Prorocentrum cordatum TaxID=2364126 RepID=A0ABN9S8H2_9DINO|nr:unnamed protein product [Polarella glacialis]
MLSKFFVAAAVSSQASRLQSLLEFSLHVCQWRSALFPLRSRRDEGVDDDLSDLCVEIDQQCLLVHVVPPIDLAEFGDKAAILDRFPTLAHLAQLLELLGDCAPAAPFLMVNATSNPPKTQERGGPCVRPFPAAVTASMYFTPCTLICVTSLLLPSRIGQSKITLSTFLFDCPSWRRNLSISTCSAACRAPL